MAYRKFKRGGKEIDVVQYSTNKCVTIRNVLKRIPLKLDTPILYP